ncbi:unnamed protein product, partial [Rotaria sp. Silwood1]
MDSSYELFTQSLHSSIAFDTKIKQSQIRKLYVLIFDKKKIPLPEPKLKSTRSNWLLWLNKNANADEIEDVFRPYFENSVDLLNEDHVKNPIIPVKMASVTVTKRHEKSEKYNDDSHDEDISRLKEIWNKNNEPNTMTSGSLWVAFLRYYTEQFNYNKNIVTIRQKEPLLRVDKGWFGKIIAIQDPFELSRNLAEHISMQ